MMHFCDEVTVYEFLPSKRQTDLCYYYQDTFDQACTLGAYHPQLFEKNMVKHLNQGTDEDIYNYGKVTLPGLRKAQCQECEADILGLEACLESQGTLIFKSKSFKGPVKKPRCISSIQFALIQDCNMCQRYTQHSAECIFNEWQERNNPAVITEIQLKI